MNMIVRSQKWSSRYIVVVAGINLVLLANIARLIW